MYVDFFKMLHKEYENVPTIPEMVQFDLKRNSIGIYFFKKNGNHYLVAKDIDKDVLLLKKEVADHREMYREYLHLSIQIEEGIYHGGQKKYYPA